MYLDHVAQWMQLSRLQLNTEKTVLLWRATARRQDQLPPAPLRAGTRNMLCLPRIICPRSQHIHQCQPHHADARQKTVSAWGGWHCIS
jgi:hypothetical protein